MKNCTVKITNPPKILIIDDEESILELYLDFLEDQPYKIKTTNSAQNAWQLIDKNIYNLVITDICMPHLDGEEFIKIIRKNKNHLGTPIIIASGEINNTHKSLARVQRNIICLTKPFERTELINLILSSLKLES
jgi:DNA-binding response OmpR family regulator